MNTKTVYSALRVICTAMLLAGLGLLNPASVKATPAISGTTLDFGAGVDAGATSAGLNAIAAADLDGDGRMDLVTGSHDATNEVLVWQNDGTPFSGTWTQTAVGGTTAPVRAVAAGDLDGDGDLDLVTTTDVFEDFEVIVWQNDGTPFNGGWTQRDVGASANGVNAVTLGDLDGDGDLDIVSGSSLSVAFEVIAWQNDGTPFDSAWTAANIGASTDSVFSVALGDLDGDGDLDALTGSSLGETFEVLVWENDGSPFTGTWVRTDAGTSTGSVDSVALGDLDGDGDLDALTGSSLGETFEVLAWENDGTPFGGTWSRTNAGTSVGSVFSVALGDLDGDGDLDVASGSENIEDFEVITWQNDGTPFSGLWAQLDVGASADTVNSVTLGDLDRDGDLDIATASSPAEDNELIVWQNNHVHRNAIFDPAGTDVGTSTAAVTTVETADFDGDGDLDIVSTGNFSGVDVVVRENDGTPFAGGAWALTGAGDASAAMFGLATGDLDGDGDPDIVSVGNSAEDFEVIAWQNDGTPFSGAWPQTDVGATIGSVHMRAVALGDIDGDGDLDIITASDLSTELEVSIWENDGTPFGGGTWTKISAGDSDSNLLAVAVGDLDRDGDLDIVAGATSGAAFEVMAWENDGTPLVGTWALTNLGALSASVNSVALGDLDRNGYLDVATVTLSFENFEVIIWQNDGTPFGGAWAQTDVGASADHVGDVALADLEGDGDLDLVTSSSSAEDFEVIAWTNDGTPFGGGVWAQADVGAASDSVHTVAVGDLDGDGDLDLVTGAAPGEDFEVMAWESPSGNAGMMPSLGLADGPLADNAEGGAFRMTFTHNGQASDHFLELASLTVLLTRVDCTTPLTSGEANALVDVLRVRLDDGDGVFEISEDAGVAEVTTLSLTSGVQTVTFPNGEAAVQLPAGGSNSYWISFQITANASSQTPYGLCASFEPDAMVVVQGKGSPDYSVSIADTPLLRALVLGHQVYLPLALK